MDEVGRQGKVDRTALHAENDKGSSVKEFVERRAARRSAHLARGDRDEFVDELAGALGPHELRRVCRDPRRPVEKQRAERVS